MGIESTDKSVSHSIAANATVEAMDHIKENVKTKSLAASVTVLLPAAGWGQRMGSPNSKEILINPEYNIAYIQFAIESVTELLCPIIIITRKEKTQLTEWIRDYKIKNPLVDLQIFFITDSSEWPDSLLQTSDLWSEYNLVLLPDTDWKPKNQVHAILNHLQHADVVYSIFPTEKLNWGFVKRMDNEFELVEKPKQLVSGFSAWGHIGFRQSAGQDILKAHLQSTMDHEVKRLPLRIKVEPLQAFQDRTRGE